MNEKKFFFKTKIHFFCPKQTLNKCFWWSLLAHNCSWVHFVTKVSLHFWNQHKILPLFDTHHVGVWKKFCLSPLMCIHEFLGPFPEVCGRSKIVFLPFSPVLHQNEAISGWQVSKIKFSLEINSPYYPLTTVNWYDMKMRDKKFTFRLKRKLTEDKQILPGFKLRPLKTAYRYWPSLGIWKMIMSQNRAFRIVIDLVVNQLSHEGYIHFLKMYSVLYSPRDFFLSSSDNNN
jgi:hypothetical protein